MGFTAGFLTGMFYGACLLATVYAMVVDPERKDR